MRKQTKLVAVLSAAALLAIGASMTSFAAAGWAEENGTWVYLDKDGDRVSEEWKKSGNQYFWLNEDGEMATEAVVDDGDDTYYVDANGARVLNKWISVPNDDLCGDLDADTIYFYFGSTGKAYKETSETNGKKTIAGKTYIFDDEGHMLYGWKDYAENTYYLGAENEGWAYTGWQYLELDDDVITIGEDNDDEEWFWFDSVGKSAVNKRKYISGAYYTFDDQGIMQDKWLIGTPGAPASDSTAYYQEDAGNQKTGWVYVVPEGKDDGDEEWFWLSSKGEPFNYNSELEGKATKHEEGKEKGDAAKENVAAKVIKNKTYLFDGNGAMLTGVWDLETVDRNGGSTSTLDGIYYFNKGDGSVKGQMMTGKQTVSYDGENYYYNFKTDGKAYQNALVDSSIYNAEGVRVNADDGNAIYEITETIYEKGDIKKPVLVATEEVVVSKSGKIKKSGTVTIDGTKYNVKDYKATVAEKQ